MFEEALRVDEREVFLTFLHTNHHAVVDVAEAAVAQGLPDEWAVGGNDKLPQVHLPLLNLGVFGHQLVLQCVAERAQLVVVSNGLDAVAREEHGVAAWYVDALQAAQDAAHVYAETAADAQLAELHACPRRAFRHFEF